MSEISRFVQIVKQAKKTCADCIVHTVCMDADMARLYANVAESYVDVARLSWQTSGSWTVESFLDTWHLGGEWIGDTWPKRGLPRVTWVMVKSL
jgi:hypothetical protein